ncbi:MAG: hypothetical protein ABIS59_02330 [Candidatus Saccharibacteria bacterium]
MDEKVETEGRNFILEVTPVSDTSLATSSTDKSGGCSGGSGQGGSQGGSSTSCR